MITEEAIQSALQAGQQQARKTIEFRDGELQRRRGVIEGLPKPSETLSLLESIGSEEIFDLLGPESRGVLAAEGDSWFDYPFNDVLRLLEDHHGYEIESVAHKGDRVEEMAYADGQLEKFSRMIEKLLRRGTIPKAILLSGGGNDIAGKEFGMLLNHAASSIAGLNDRIVSGVINERIRIAYITILSKITELCRIRLGSPIPIVLHGYDYPVADGRGFAGGWWFLPGPWLEPGFREKGFQDLPERIRLAKDLIDTFNEMLIDITSMSAFAHVHHVDLRGTLSTGDDYEDDWANELHPTASGFEQVVQLVADRIDGLP